ncbi:flavin monoamine oxidase family protein [Fimbriimonas ginsengisoli]|uniref:Amine oxidase n=1 Tax=Fimbriimonas ginsengisoli Gsoil 348 TaxID=661478 RepID=A0A068NPZ4_FIMGI|nr:FAD-dependent oxidoreductase [Fimbriimonas ginsengisoli]AIE84835.1 amine oxidase [Fimbriimonas ginsengisoli Gsoil 348]
MTVGIVGLGAAGLRTAMLLERAGVTVRLFEARYRPGGRMFTADEGNGAVYEAGGEWIDADHLRCLDLMGEFGLEPNEPVDWPRKLVHKGKECTDVTLWNDALEDDLRVEAAAREFCSNLREPPWENLQAKELDRQVLGDFLREHTSSERGLWWVTAKYRSDEGDDPDRIGLLGWLSGYLHYMDREGEEMSAYRFPGGASRLFERMIGTLKAEPVYGAVLHRVRQDASGVTLIFENGEARVDRVILTLPPPALERVVFEPAISVEKRCAVEACRMSRAIKIVWEFDRPWWEEAGWGGSMLCDGPLQQTWDASGADAPVLSAYICGDRAVEWSRLGDPVRAGVYELSLLFPQAAKSFQRGWIHDWVNDPYAQGAFSHLAPEYVLEHMRYIAPAEGRVHFAGEHTAMWTGFIEGALESAERVVEEIIRTES